MTEAPEERQTGKLRRVLLDVGPPKVAHLVSWTMAGSQVLLEIGYFDLRAIHEQNRADFKGERVLDWFVTDRFIFDLDAAQRATISFAELADKLEDIQKQADNADAKNV